MNYLAGVCFCLCVVADADEEDVRGVLTHFRHVVAGKDLGDGILGCGVLLQPSHSLIFLGIT